MSRAEKQRRRERRREKRDERRVQRAREILRQVTDAWRAGEPEPAVAAGEGVRVLSYDITEEALQSDEADGVILQINEAERAELFDLVHDNPAAALPRLRAWCEKFPESPTLRNWLTMAYCGAGDHDSADAESRALYQRHPDYLFAKVAMGHLCLRRGDLEGFEQVFDNKFDLKLLYPHREVFHVSEALALASVMVEYSLRKREHDKAEMYLDVMEKIAPDHPITRQARQVMDGSLLLEVTQAISDLLRRPSKPRRRRKSAAIEGSPPAS